MAPFLQNIVRSGVLGREELQAVLREPAAAGRNTVEGLAEHLVTIGKLTRFQAHHLLSGTILGLVLGPFHIQTPIGKGGMGTVYLARDTRNQQLVAVKVLPPKRAKQEDRMLARFRREMELCQKVAHPHLTRTLEVGEHKGIHYIVMEYIPGHNLFQLIHRQGPLTVPRAARLFAEVAAGLEHAHAQGLIHRDLKASNIMITPNDTAKVLDLGLALMANELPSDRTIVGGQGYVVGTMDYVSPEQAEDSSKVDARSDIYSLGCTIYFALAGQPPFPGGNAIQKIMRHRTETPVPVPELNPVVPVEFYRLIQVMMAKRPERRFPTAAAVREALLPWVDRPPTVITDDSNFQSQAEATLHEADASPEQTWEAIIQGTRTSSSSSVVRPAAKGPVRSPATPPEELPFWFDFGVPVAIGGMLWLIVLIVLLLAWRM
ncbi:MAG: serine/threonine-protein kinase [Gemmataceae bacterium]